MCMVGLPIARVSMELFSTSWKQSYSTRWNSEVRQRIGVCRQCQQYNVEYDCINKVYIYWWHCVMFNNLPHAVGAQLCRLSPVDAHTVALRGEGNRLSRLRMANEIPCIIPHVTR